MGDSSETRANVTVITGCDVCGQSHDARAMHCTHCSSPLTVRHTVDSFGRWYCTGDCHDAAVDAWYALLSVDEKMRLPDG